MHVAPPVEITEHIPLVRLLLFGAVGLGLLFVLTMILRTLTGRSHRAHHLEEAGTHVSHPRSALVPALLVSGLLVVGVVLVGTLSVMPYQMTQENTPITATHQLPQVPLTQVSIDKDETGSSEQNEEDENHPSQLPSWTKSKQTVLATGEVPSVLFVETSGLYSTQEEAMTEAVQQAIGKFRSRLAETYSNLAVQPVPEKIFRAASMKQIHVEKRMHSFGAYEEPMYRVYLQYLDSAEAREPVIEAWKSTFAGNRAVQYGVGFGVLAALLGVVSAGLRAISAAKGSRGRAVMTVLAFAGLGLVGLLFVA